MLIRNSQLEVGVVIGVLKPLNLLSELSHKAYEKVGSVISHTFLKFIMNCLIMVLGTYREHSN